MIRTVVLLLVNLAFALVLALSVTPAALVVAPVLRDVPTAGYAVLVVTTAAFVAMNAALWRGWQRRQRSR
jgi:membrane protein implicated in regulation of membrane protease activity